MRFWKPTILCLFLLLFSTVANAKILFTSRRGGVKGIYIMNDNGSNVTLLNNTTDPFWPAWSPDGKQIVFKRRSVGFFLMNVDGSNIRQITDKRDSYPCFSPDGKFIVFDRIVKIDVGDKAIGCVLNLRSGRINKIYDDDLVVPDWSPDGKHIVFAGTVVLGGAGGNISIMEADGNNPRALLLPVPVGDLKVHRLIPRWSPNGKQIVYKQYAYAWEERKPGVPTLIRKEFQYIICDRNGRKVKQLNIPKDWQIIDIDWMDDGKSVVFSAREYELNEPAPRWGEAPPKNIYKYHIAASKITQLTETGDDNSVDWISDKVLSVNPAGKQPMRWGELKKVLQTQGAAFKALSQSMLFFLRFAE